MKIVNYKRFTIFILTVCIVFGGLLAVVVDTLSKKQVSRINQVYEEYIDEFKRN